MNSHLRLWAAAVLATAVISGNASAQLEEIIVTATHRAENIQDIPVTVTAIDRDFLEKADIFDPTSLALRVPGMTYGEFAPGQALISLRGIISADDGAGLDNSVALFLDGVYIGRGASINFDMFDLERIEVLRGPQGTLFGRNAIGGALSVITQKPADTPEMKVGVTAGNEGIFRYQALVSGPISDNVSGKLSIAHREHDGFVDKFVEIKGTLNENLAVVDAVIKVDEDGDGDADDDNSESSDGEGRRARRSNRLDAAEGLSLEGDVETEFLETPSGQQTQELELSFHNAEPNAEFQLRVTFSETVVDFGTVRANGGGRVKVKFRSEGAGQTANILTLLPEGETVENITMVEVLDSGGNLMLVGIFD